MSRRKPSNALIHARDILGPAATVQRTPTECKVIAPGVAIYGTNWEHVLGNATKEPQAKVWNDFKDARKLAFIEAFNSLKAKARELLGPMGKLLDRQERHFVKNSLRGLA